MDLNGSEERYRLIVDTIMDGFWLSDIQGRLLDVNETYCRMSGYSRIELLTMYIYDFDVLESESEVHRHIDTIREKGEVRFESKHRRKDGSIMDVEVGVQFHLVNGGQCVSFIRDITERNRKENELYEERNDWENTFDSITDMITIHDINYNIVRSNKAAKEYLGLPELNRIIGAKCFKYYHGTNNPPNGCPSCDCLKSGLPGIFEMFEPHLNIFLEIRAIPRIDINNKLIGLVHIVRDISDHKKAEKELIKAKEKAEESDRLKSAFLANMSHEIRTPMNGILGFAHLLKEPKLTGEEQSNYIRVIERSGARMLNVINDIMDISKIESGQMKMSIAKTNINKQIDYLCTFFKPEIQSKGIVLNCTCTLPDAEASINSDREKIYAILTNLLKNAIKYSTEGTIDFGYDKKGKFLEFFVKDTGIGIAEDRQEAIFERFVQADLSDSRAMQGAGLGLTITKAYVEMLGGRIWVESELGKGTAFYFTIPYFVNTDDHISINLNRANDEKSGIKSLKILIAEDDEFCELLLRKNLEKYSKSIISVINGVEAVGAIRNNPDIDLIMMDIKMPEMDGYEATREIRKFNKDVIIIAQTAFALMGDMEKFINVGCNDYLSKPINNNKLNDLIVKYFGGEHRKKLVTDK